MVFVAWFIAAIISHAAYADPQAISLETSVVGETYGTNSWVYSGEADFEDVIQEDFQSKFVKSLREVIFLPLEKTTMWVKIPFSNPTNQVKTLWIHESLNYTDYFALYTEDEGLIGSLSSEGLRDRTISLNLPPNTTKTVYIKKSSVAVQIQTWSYWSDYEDLVGHLSISHMHWGIATAIFFTSLIFNIILFLSFKDRYYLSYCVYIVTMMGLSTLLWGVFELRSVSEIFLTIMPMNLIVSVASEWV